MKVESSQLLFFKRDEARSRDFRDTSYLTFNRCCCAAIIIEDDIDTPSPSAWSKSSMLLLELSTREATSISGIDSIAMFRYND